MNIQMKLGAALLVIITLAGCAHSSMADYAAAIAKDGSFAADDAQFAVNSEDYPVFALISGVPKQDPEVGAYKGPLEWTTDILPSDRWEIMRSVSGRFLAYSDTYGKRYCKEQLSSRGKMFANKCDSGGQKYADFYVYLYLSGDGVAYGWQFVNNKTRSPFEKTLFRVRPKGDWSGQPWFKCVERCDKLVNMK